MEPVGSLDGELKKIEGMIHVRNLLMRAAEDQYDCIFWSKDQALQMKSVLVDHRDRDKTFSIEISDGLTEADIVKKLEKNPEDQHLLVILQRSEPVLCVKAVYAGTSPDEVRFHIPSYLLELQRRKNERYQLPWGYEVNCNLEFAQPGVRQRRVIDVSEGGMSFLVGHAESREFNMGLKINGVSFSLRHRSFNVDIEVKQVTEIVNDPRKEGFRVGCAFTRIEKESSQYLYEFVGEQIALNISQHFGF